jgi:hypothetical protein
MQVNKSMRIKFVLLSLFLIFFSCKNDSENSQRNQSADGLNKKDNVKTKRSKNLDLLIITGNSFMNYKVGDLIEEDEVKVLESTMETGEGVFIVYDLMDEKNGKLGYLTPLPEKLDKVHTITILSPLAKTKESIHVGSTFSELLKKFPQIKVHGSEIEGRVHASQENLWYRLDFNSNEYELDKNLIPTKTKITEIIIH